jgi:nucleotide-binding universal stress UspA family protein
MAISHPPAGGQPRRPRILVAIGRSALGDTKLPVARDYARAFDADVVLLHVPPADMPVTGPVRTAMERHEALPPVDLYQIGYYVLDGHHPVAAARMIGQLEIDANVVQFVT